MEETMEGGPPPVFHELPFNNAVQLNIYAIEGDGLVKAYERLLLENVKFPDGFWNVEEPEGWRRQSILGLNLPHQQLRMTMNDLTTSNVLLADGSTGKKDCRVFILSPLLEVEGMHGFYPDGGQPRKPKAKKVSEAIATKEEIDIDDWLDEAAADSSESSPPRSNTSAPRSNTSAPRSNTSAPRSNTSVKRERSPPKINPNGRISVSGRINGRFPGLARSIEQFSSFVLAVDGLANRILSHDRRALKDLELLATYHTHVAKSDAYSSSKYRQPLEELQAAHEEGGAPLTECVINLKVKGGYIARTSTSSLGGGVYKAPSLDTIDHLSDAFDPSKYVPSTLEELVQHGKNCCVQFLFHLGQLYERHSVDREGVSVYRGITLKVYRIVFWGVADRRIKPSVEGTGESLWGVTMQKSLAPSTAFYSSCYGSSYVEYDEFGNKKT